jgi:hypothetical protein
MVEGKAEESPSGGRSLVVYRVVHEVIPLKKPGSR